MSVFRYGDAVTPLLGNGGNWLGLVVACDRVELSGWTLEWTNDDAD